MHGRILLLLLLLLSFHLSASSHHREKKPLNDLVKSSCIHASYPRLCIRTLATYPGPAITTPRDLAGAAVKVSLSSARRAASFLSSIKSASGRRQRRERTALLDCVEQISDSVDELSRTLELLQHLGRRGEEPFQWEMSNAETWVSAALTNEDTCLDGFDGVSGETKGEVKRRITNVARITSNALYMVNRLDGTRGKP